jgi:D-alanyl-D-alanine carboxypeptidase/D-alanyl-D-alanine-endopeptidase (penicillin-binding protein 4)
MPFVTLNRSPTITLHRRWVGALLALVAPLWSPVAGHAQAAPTSAALADRVQRILDRSEFQHAIAGVAIYSLDTHERLLAINADKLFVPGSTTKLLTTANSLDALGPDYRFHTRVYRTGPITKDGTLDGDLVLVASGDLNLSGRASAGDTLAFTNEDHSYGGSVDTRAVPGDPLLVLRHLAQQVAAHHITRVHGHVRVDASLFAQGTRELGTGVVISPIVVNDNVVDVTVTPGRTAGDPATITVAPVTAYVHIINHATTAEVGTTPSIALNDSARADSSQDVTVSGTMPAAGPPILYAYPVPNPQRFAEVAFAGVLRDAGVNATVTPGATAGPRTTPGTERPAEDVVAEHVSLPWSEEIKVTLKVSQNLHASTIPYLLSALRGHADSAPQPAFDLEHAFLQRAGVDVNSAVQSDGAGGAAEFTPDFMVRFLTYMASRPDYQVYLHALPILGRDGTLAKIQTQSAAAGHVFAKTGTFVTTDALNRNLLVSGKGLAGYITTADGRHLVFAAYFNNVSVPPGEKGVEMVGQALGEIAAVAYDSPSPLRQ